MNWGSRSILLGLLLASSAPLGCRNWQYGPLQTVTPPPQGVADALSAAQAAQLCRSAGEELEKKGFTAEAVRQYESARKYDAQAPAVARHLAVLYDLQDNPAAAESEYLRAVQEQPHDAELLNDLGYFHYRHHRLQVAETWLRNALAVNPEYACACINLGQVLAEQGRAQESFQAFAHVLRPAEAYSNLGVMLAKQGRTAEARTALQQALALDPGLGQPRAFLNALPSAPDALPPDITRTTLPVQTPMPSILPSLPTPPPVQTPLPQVVAPTPPAVQMPLPQVVAPTPPPGTVATRLERPLIVNGPIQPISTNYAPTSIGSAVASKTTMVSRPLPPSPPPPPAPSPLVLRPSVAEDDPILIRTSALLNEKTFEELSAPESPRPLPAMSSSKPLSPSLPPAPLQATLTDCQTDATGSAAPAP